MEKYALDRNLDILKYDTDKCTEAQLSAFKYLVDNNHVPEALQVIASIRPLRSPRSPTRKRSRVSIDPLPVQDTDSDATLEDTACESTEDPRLDYISDKIEELINF